MGEDQINRLARTRIVKASIDLEVQLSTRQGGAVAIEVLRRLRDRATESLAALAFVDPFNPKAIMTLQNEVKRYDEWLVWLRQIIDEGKTYDRELNEAEREELLDLLTTSEEGEQEAAGLGLVIPGVRHDAA